MRFEFSIATSCLEESRELFLKNHKANFGGRVFGYRLFTMNENQTPTLTRSLDLSRVRRLFQKKSGRQTDKHFVSKRDIKWLFTPPSFFSSIQRPKKRNKKPLKRLCYGPTDRPTDRQSGL